MIKVLNVIVFMCFLTVSSQTVILKGVITDSLQNPLGYANILAMPEADDQEVRLVVKSSTKINTFGISTH